jgi:hypothetical protein
VERLPATACACFLTNSSSARLNLRRPTVCVIVCSAAARSRLAATLGHSTMLCALSRTPSPGGTPSSSSAARGSCFPTRRSTRSLQQASLEPFAKCAACARQSPAPPSSSSPCWPRPAPGRLAPRSSTTASSWLAFTAQACTLPTSPRASFCPPHSPLPSLPHLRCERCGCAADGAVGPGRRARRVGPLLRGAAGAHRTRHSGAHGVSGDGGRGRRRTRGGSLCGRGRSRGACLYARRLCSDRRRGPGTLRAIFTRLHPPEASEPSPGRATPLADLFRREGGLAGRRSGRRQGRAGRDERRG